MSDKKEPSNKSARDAPINRASRKSWIRKASAAAVTLIGAVLIIAGKRSKS